MDSEGACAFDSARPPAAMISACRALKKKEPIIQSDASWWKLYDFYVVKQRMILVLHTVRGTRGWGVFAPCPHELVRQVFGPVQHDIYDEDTLNAGRLDGIWATFNAVLQNKSHRERPYMVAPAQAFFQDWAITFLKNMLQLQNPVLDAIAFVCVGLLSSFTGILQWTDKSNFCKQVSGYLHLPS